jgi:hypothetical protein
LQDSGKEEQPKLKFVSRAEETVLLIFNLRLVSESPYNVNPDLRPNVKRQFEKYTQRLQEIIGFEEFNKLHRNKRSIKDELRRRREKETIDLEVTQEMQGQQKFSPILQTYSQLAFTERTQDQPTTAVLPEPPRQFSHTVFTAISSPRLLRSRTSPIPRETSHCKSTSSIVHSAIVHNTWV